LALAGTVPISGKHEILDPCELRHGDDSTGVSSDELMCRRKRGE
jgi:hypothetical protein